jgi:uncharacterized protein (DUF2141 family)
MQKTIFLYSLTLFILFLSAFTFQNKKTLKVVVSNFEKKAQTKVRVSVFSKRDFLEKPIQSKIFQVVGDQIIAEFDLDPGDYAVSTYQDLNNNGKLDRYFIGKPKEPYGFSNNVKPFGPPSFDDCKFKITSSSKTISISLIN